MSSADIYEKTPWWAKIFDNINENIILWDWKLNSTLLLYTSKKELLVPKIVSSCIYNQKNILNLKWSWTYIYWSLIKIDEDCNDWKVYIWNWDEIYKDSEYSLPILTRYEIIKRISDFTDAQISEKKAFYEILNMQNLEKIRELEKKDDINSRLRILRTRYYIWANDYKSLLISDIQNKRANFWFTSPIKWKPLPIKKNLIPNALRPYRAKYTDWIHHWWDIFANRWTPVMAVWDWIIIRVVSDFNWTNFDKILWKDLNYKEKMHNLDIYRWNQVWLQTADWNVVIYSHLWNIYNLKEWQIVSRWYLLWEVDKSWVPDKEYKDYHLHFEIQKNPHSGSEYTKEDIMQWGFLWKDESFENIISLQTKLFNK